VLAPKKRPASPGILAALHAQKIAGAALYFASNASSFTTGTVLAVDGGAQWAMPARI